MNIIIVGMGKVGYRLASSLADENNDITVMDSNEEAMQKANDNLDIMCLTGNGVSVKALLEAGIKDCDVLIAVTASDEVNMMCCLMGKKLGAKYTVARIRELYYNEEIYLLKEELDLNMVINPEEAAAQEISKKLKYSSVNFIESFASGGADLVEMQVDEGCAIKNRSIAYISANIYSEILIAVVMRGEDTFVPNGSFVIKEGDSIYIMGTHKHIMEFHKRCKKESEFDIKNIMIVGGGKIALYLTELVKPAGIKAKVIERNKEASELFAQQIKNGIVIHGDGTDEDLLVSEELEDMDAFIALTGHDEDNLMSGLFAHEHDVPKIIVKITRPNYTHIVKRLGIAGVVSPSNITANRILKFIRMFRASDGRYIESLYKILGGQIEIIQYKIDAGFKAANIPLMNLDIPSDLLVAVIARGKEVIIPNGQSVIKKGDSIILITNKPIDKGLNQLFIPGAKHES